MKEEGEERIGKKALVDLKHKDIDNGDGGNEEESVDKGHEGHEVLEGGVCVNVRWS